MPFKDRGICCIFIGVKKSTEQKSSFLHATLLLDLIYLPIKMIKFPQTVWEL